jgi:hypothetical protein
MLKENEKEKSFLSGALPRLVYGGVSGIIGIVLGVSVATTFNRNGTISVDEVNQDLAKHNSLSPTAYCKEARKAIKKLDDYFTSVSKTNKPPPFTLDMDRCKENLKLTDSAPTQPQP